MLILDKRCRSRRHRVACWTVGQPTLKREWEREREKTKQSQSTNVRHVTLFMRFKTWRNTLRRLDTTSTVLSSPHYPLYDLSSFASFPCVTLCVCVCVWSTFLAQVISAHFMLKSEKPSSASGSERRLGGTHMFSFCGVLVDRASSSLLLLLLRCTPEWAKRAWYRGRQRIAHGSPE